MTHGGRGVVVKLSRQAEALVNQAIEQIKGQKGQHVRVTRSEALDWLLQDSVYYGSPVVRSWAKKVWPEMWEREQAHRKALGIEWLNPHGIDGGSEEEDAVYHENYGDPDPLDDDGERMPQRRLDPDAPAPPLEGGDWGLSEDLDDGGMGEPGGLGDGAER